MRHPERLEDYLDHLAEAVTRATGYVQTLQGIEDLEKNQLVQDAIIRNIEIIGEAVSIINRTAPDFIRQHPEIPWARMRRMRNIVIHRYFAVDLNLLWTTVTNVLPPLKEQIDQLLSQQRAPPPSDQQPEPDRSR